MAAPAMAVPAQWPSARRLEAGDALTCEISAAWWDHPGQLLRTFAVAAEPSPLYRELHAAADAAFDAILAVLRPGASAADVVAAAGVIEDAGFTTRDDLLHGFVGGYLPPVVGSPSRQIAPIPDFAFAAGMTVVVQPNVVTADERAGVQTGELVLIGEDGPERLHGVERGLLRAGVTDSRSLRIRDATAGDWPAVWPIVREVVRAADTFPYDPAMDEGTARAMWMLAAPGRTPWRPATTAPCSGRPRCTPTSAGPGAHVASASFMVGSGRPRARRRAGAGRGRARVGARRRVPGDAVQRRRRVESGGGRALRVAGLRRHGDDPGGLPPPGRRATSRCS